MLGNELTIRWALFGVAMTSASLGIGQSGWNGPILIYSLFALAIVFGFAALFWGTLSTQVLVLQRAAPFLGRHLRTRFAIQAVTAIALLGVTYVTVHMAVGGSEKAPNSINRIVIDPQMPVESAYNDDFKDYLRIDSTVDYHSLRGDAHVRGMQQLVINFESNSEFLSFYVPSTGIVYSVCFNIADNIEELLRNSRKLLISEQKKGDFNKSQSIDLTFSGVVYLYTEDALDEGGMAAVTNKFKTHNIAVRFRNPSNVKTATANPFN